MRRYNGWLLFCILPLLLLAAAPLLPVGTDPRGFGPGFALSMVACGISLVLGLAGAGLLLFGKRLPLYRGLLVVATCVGAAPFLYLVGLIILSRA